MVRISALALGLALTAFAGESSAADKVSAFLATLSTAKAQTEGRAQRVIACPALQRAAVLQDLRGRYDSARNHFNGRIDGWLFSLRQRKEFSFAADSETTELSSAITKVNDFIAKSDAALSAAPCGTKVFWKEVAVAVIGISPALVEALRSLWPSVNATDNEREAFIKALEQYRIAEWGMSSPIVAFDLQNQMVIPAGQVTDEIAQQAATAIYVNKWVVRDSPGGGIVPTKLPPAQLSKDYILFTGKPSEVGRLTIHKE